MVAKKFLCQKNSRTYNISYDTEVRTKEQSLIAEAEGGEEVEESKWQDRIAYRFDQIISTISSSTGLEDKRRRSDDTCNTSPDSGIGHGEAGTAAGAAAGSAAGGAAGEPLAPHHFKKRFFQRERWGAWSGTPPPAVDWERPPM